MQKSYGLKAALLLKMDRKTYTMLKWIQDQRQAGSSRLFYRKSQVIVELILMKINCFFIFIWM